jgi:hypothetical protein
MAAPSMGWPGRAFGVQARVAAMNVGEILVHRGASVILMR